jgi:Sugar phosphate permease
MEPKQKKGIYYGWWVVIAVFLLLVLSYGIRQSFGIYLKPLCLEFGWGRGLTAGLFSAFHIVYGIGAFVMGTLTDRYGPRKVCSLGAVLLGAGLLIASQTTQGWQLYLSYAILVGFGVGAMYVPGTATVAKFFVKRRGVSMAIAAAGFGIGTLILNPLSEFWIISYGWRMAFIISAALIIVIGTPIAAIVLRRSPEEIGLLPDGMEKPIEAPKEDSSTTEVTYTAREALKIPRFWILLATYALLVFVVMSVINHVYSFATDTGIAREAAATAVGFIGLGTIAGMLGFGVIGDRWGRRYCIMASGIGIALCILWLSKINTVGMFSAWAIVYGFFWGGFPMSVAGLVADLFGRKSTGTLLGLCTVATGITGAIGPWLTGYIFDITGSYATAFPIFIGFALAATICAFFLHTKPVELKAAK